MFVFLGGALGSALRFAVAHLMQGRTAWLTGTLAVNWAGCLLMGGLATWLAGRTGSAVWLKPFLLVGVLGGFTTFSAFALETHAFWDVHPVRAALYVFLSVGGGLAFFRLGAGVIS